MDNPDPGSDKTGQKQPSIASTTDGLKLIKTFLKMEAKADCYKLCDTAERLGGGSVDADSMGT
jgi:hypothetical protein